MDIPSIPNVYLLFVLLSVFSALIKEYWTKIQWASHSKWMKITAIHVIEFREWPLCLSTSQLFVCRPLFDTNQHYFKPTLVILTCILCAHSSAIEVTNALEYSTLCEFFVVVDQRKSDALDRFVCNELLTATKQNARATQMHVWAVILFANFNCSTFQSISEQMLMHKWREKNAGWKEDVILWY